MPRYGPYSLLFQQFGGAAFGLPYGTVTPDRDGFSLDAFLAGLSDGFAFDFATTDRMFQESTGPTLADDVTDPIGLALESREWNGRTLAQELAGQAELRGTGVPALAGSATAAAYNTGTGVGTATRVDFSNQSAVSFAATNGETYALDIETTNAVGLFIRGGGPTAASLFTFAGSTRQTIYLAAAGGAFALAAQSAATATFTVHSVKLVPGNHGVQSSSSLRGARAVFYGYSDDQAELVTNGGFDVDANWTISATGTAISSGILSWDGSAGGFGANFVSQAGLAVSSPKLYAVTYTVTRVAGSVRLNLGVGGATAGPARSASGTYTNYVVPSGSFPTSLSIQGDNFNGSVDNVSVKEVPASRITTGCKYDGSDDNHLTTYKASSGPNFIVAYVNVPTTIASTQVITGVADAAFANFYMGISSAGLLRVGVGGTPNTIGTTDLRGKSVVIAVTTDETTYRCFVDGVQEGVDTPLVSPEYVPSSVPFRLGCFSADGTAAVFFAGTIKSVIAGPEYLTLARYLQIRNDLINQ